MTIRKFKKATEKEYQQVNSTIVERTLAYITKKYKLTSDYQLTGFKTSTKGIEIKVRNKDVECTYLIINSEIVTMLTAEDTQDEEVEDLE